MDCPERFHNRGSFQRECGTARPPRRERKKLRGGLRFSRVIRSFFETLKNSANVRDDARARRKILKFDSRAARLPCFFTPDPPAWLECGQFKNIEEKNPKRFGTRYAHC
jgi:hypothetical protein